MPLGDFYEPAAIPACQQVLDLAARVGPGATLVTAERPRLRRRAHGGADRARLGRYALWVQGSVGNPLTSFVDGREVGSVDYQLNESGQFLDLGHARLTAGTHVVSLVLDDQSLAPGSGGPPEPIGPLVLSPVAGNAQVSALPVSRARELCERRLDWIEATP